MSEIKGTISTKGIIKGSISALGATTKPVKVSKITLYADKWEGTESPYSQVVTVPGATTNSMINLSLTIEQANVFYQKDVAFMAENDNGIITIYCVGQKPTRDYEIQATIVEVATNG